MKFSDNVVLTGFKTSGKTRIGKRLAKRLEREFVDIDRVIEDIYAEDGNQPATVREIFSDRGRVFFRRLEAKAVKRLCELERSVIALGGGTPLNEGFSKEEFDGAVFVYLKVSPDVLFERIERKGFPPFVNPENPRDSIFRLIAERTPQYEKIADITVDNSPGESDKLVEEIIEKLEAMNGG
jgi:shikimate kinase